MVPLAARATCHVLHYNYFIEEKTGGPMFQAILIIVSIATGDVAGALSYSGAPESLEACEARLVVARPMIDAQLEPQGLKVGEAKCAPYEETL